MIYPHRIRLRGPWECEPVACLVPGKEGSVETSTKSLPTPRRMKMPCRWKDGGLTEFSGQVRFRRRFGYPGRIDDYERVWLTFSGLSEKATISLNEQALGSCTETDCPWEVEITKVLQPNNRLDILLESSTDEGGLWGEVALEIRRTAFLKEVQVNWLAESGQIQATGMVVGVSDRPLDLYLLANGSTIGYDSIMPQESGQPFTLCSDPLDVKQREILLPLSQANLRMELIDGGVIWYSVDFPCQETHLEK